MKVAADPHNAFASLIPAPAALALGRAALAPPDGLPGAILRSWWELSGESPFFRTPACARAVRAMLRGGRGISDD